MSSEQTKLKQIEDARNQIALNNAEIGRLARENADLLGRVQLLLTEMRIERLTGKRQPDPAASPEDAGKE